MVVIYSHPGGRINGSAQQQALLLSRGVIIALMMKNASIFITMMTMITLASIVLMVEVSSTFMIIMTVINLPSTACMVEVSSTFITTTTMITLSSVVFLAFCRNE